MAENPFFGRTLATLTVFLSLASTIVGGISAWSADQAKRQAEATQRAFEQSRLAKDYQIRVFEMVDKSMTADGGLVLASAYVSSIDDARLQASVAEAIRAVGRARLRAGKLTPEEAEALQIMITAARESAAEAVQSSADVQPDVKAAAILASPLSQVGSARTANVAAVNPVGYDVDVFWCAAKGQPSRSLAESVARDLAGRADRREQLAGQQLGRIRVRQLSDVQAARGRFPTSTNEVRGDAGEEALAQALASAATGLAPDRPFAPKRMGSATKWYLSLFACGV